MFDRVNVNKKKKVFRQLRKKQLGHVARFVQSRQAPPHGLVEEEEEE